MSLEGGTDAGKVRGSRTKWVVLGVVALASFVLAGYVVKQVVNAPAKFFSGFVQYDSKTVVSSSITACRNVGRLVVLTTDIDVEVKKSETEKAVWDYLNLGTTTVRMKARENRVQFYIDLREMRQEDFEFDSDRGVLKARIPRPVLDEEMVSVQSDPGKIEVETAVGWASLDMWKGEEMRQKARAALRGEVLRAVKTAPLVVDRAEDRGLAEFKEQFGKQLAALMGRPVGVEVEYKVER